MRKPLNNIYDNEDEEATPEELQSLAWTVISVLAFFVVLVAGIIFAI